MVVPGIDKRFCEGHSKAELDHSMAMMTTMTMMLMLFMMTIINNNNRNNGGDIPVFFERNPR